MQKVLIVELMGKHSNIIFCQPDNAQSLTASSTFLHRRKLRAGGSPGTTVFYRRRHSTKLNPLRQSMKKLLSGEVLSQAAVGRQRRFTPTDHRHQSAHCRGALLSGLPLIPVPDTQSFIRSWIQLHLYRTFAKLNGRYH